MCGITGYWSFDREIDLEEYYNAHLKVAHRGPDDEGFLRINQRGEVELLVGDDTNESIKQVGKNIKGGGWSKFLLGHRRLSIIDLSPAGHQPMRYEELYIVYNGEIYNYKEIRRELEEIGYVFKTNTDTEVFLIAYYHWRTKAFRKFNGMWAAAIYDCDNDVLLLVRDRFGIKPLYYCHFGTTLIFGSEIKFIASLLDEVNVEKEAVLDYLKFALLDHGEKTFFKNIYRLEPSHYLIFASEGIRKQKYWDIEEPPFKSEDEDYQDHLRRLLMDSIRLRLRSDVQLGLLLSGGLDSAIIGGMTIDEKLIDHLATYSVIYKEKEYSEEKFIRKTANRIQSQIHLVEVGSESFILDLKEFFFTQEEPVKSIAAYCQYCLYKYIRDYTDTIVLLNGQGADELFGGYNYHYYYFLATLVQKGNIPRFLIELNNFVNNKKQNIIMTFSEVAKILVKKFLGKDYVRRFPYRLFVDEIDYVDSKKTRTKYNDIFQNKLWNELCFSALKEYLRYEDKNSMRFSLEVRVPYLDYRIVNFAFGLGSEMKIKNGISKVILREVAKKYVDVMIIECKQKYGFITPQKIWMENMLNDHFHKVFSDIYRNGFYDFLDCNEIMEIYKRYQVGRFNDWWMIWRIFSLYEWSKVWGIDG